MNSVRSGAATAQLQDGKVLVAGGYNISDVMNSVEMLTEEGWESNIPSLPVTLIGHCMVTVNSTTVMVIGGEQNGQESGNTFFFTFGKESWTEGPALKFKRVYHSCGKIRRNKASKEMSIIVAGSASGFSSVFSSVEILDEGSNDWLAGPKLPFGIYFSEMVEDQNGGVVLIGGVSKYDTLDTIYQLPHGGQDAGWTKMEQKMKTGRYQHVAFLIPDNIVDCS